jgi:hypothetical protein
MHKMTSHQIQAVETASSDSTGELSRLHGATSMEGDE